MPTITGVNIDSRQKLQKNIVTIEFTTLTLCRERSFIKIEAFAVLVLTSQTNLVMESGVHSSLHPNCHHRVVFAKFNLFLLYPPPYERNVWFYKKANLGLIRRAINETDWLRGLSNVSIERKFAISQKRYLI